MYKARDWRLGVPWGFVFFVIFTATCYKFASADVFGLSSATERYSRDVFYRIWSVAYPKTPSQKSTVVIIEDRDLQDVPWPPPYAMHAAVLDALLAYKPSAVFVDIPLIDARADPTIKNITTIAENFKKKGIPLFWAAPSKKSGARIEARQELVELSTKGALQFVSIDAESYVSNRAYTLVTDNVPSAAEALFRSTCQQQPLDCSAHDGVKQFEIWWGGPPSSLNCRLIRPDIDFKCDDVSSLWVLRGAYLLWNSITFSTLNNREADPIPVPYTPTAFWTEVVNGGLPESVKEQMRGSVVFYGAHFALAEDTIDNPVYGMNRTVPGVFLHAIAYDNLMTLGSGLIEPVPPIGKNLFLAILIVCACGFYACVDWLLRRCHYGIRWAGGYASFWAFVLSMIWIEFSVFHISPSNWIGACVASYPALEAASYATRSLRLLWLKKLSSWRIMGKLT